VELILLVAGGVAAGVFGSLLGLGGGILIVPLLTFGAGLPIREAVGVSLVCVIVVSGTGASVYLRRGAANLRLGMFLELFTAGGALVGGLIAFLLPDRVLAALFALLLGYVAVTMLRAARRVAPAAVASSAGIAASAGPPPDESAAAPASRRTALLGRISGTDYEVQRLAPGAAGASTAGILASLLGIGGGIVTVPVMHLVMGVPLRVATATSTLMIGVTATAGALIYLFRGGIDAYVAGPMVIGVFLGASVGSRIAGWIDVTALRLLFVAVQVVVAFQMVLLAIGEG